MKILIQPTEFIRDELGADVTLIYGDMRDSKPALYSLKPLNGYGNEGCVFVRSIDESDPPIKDGLWHLESAFSNPFPRGCLVWKHKDGKLVRTKETVLEPSEFEKAVLGVSGSYGYAPSPDFIKHINPKLFEFLREKAPLELVYPVDASLAHEGAHIGTAPYKGSIFPRFYVLFAGMEDEWADDDEKPDALDEAAAIFEELRYLESFHPEFLDCYKQSRTNEEQNWRHRIGYNIATNEPNAVAEMIEMVREMNLAAQNKH